MYTEWNTNPKIFGKFGKPPPLRTENMAEMWFRGLNSEILTGTAGTSTFGRSQRLRRVHGSEVCLWDTDVPELIASLMEASRARSAEISMETTAQGASGWFYETWAQMDEDKDNPDKPWENIFIPWTMDFRNSVELRYDEVLEPTHEELELQRLYNCTIEQLKWRRLKKFELGNLFNQEYPITWESAFLVTGNTFIDAEIINLMIRDATPGEPVTLRGRGGEEYTILVWEAPVKGGHYIIGADPGKGVTGGDKSVAIVMNAITGNQCAEIRGTWIPEQFAARIYAMHLYYNKAILNVERNLESTISSLMRDFHCFKMCYEMKMDGSMSSTDPGFMMMAPSRLSRLSDVRRAIIERYTGHSGLRVNSPETVNEFKHLIGHAAGPKNNRSIKYECRRPYFDDGIFALIGCVIGQSQAIPLEIYAV